MDFLVAQVREVHPDHILVECKSQIGYRLFTLVEDEYMINQQYKLFIYEDIRLENNSISINRFTFMDPHVRKLFKFLIGLKGVGPKSARGIILSFGGSKKLIDSLCREEREKIIQANKKYAMTLINAMAKPKNQELLGGLSRSICHKSIRSEVLWILLQMEYEREKCLSAMDSLNEHLVKQGNSLGIEGLKVEEAVRECLSRLFSG